MISQQKSHKYLTSGDLVELVKTITTLEKSLSGVKDKLLLGTFQKWDDVKEGFSDVWKEAKQATCGEPIDSCFLTTIEKQTSVAIDSSPTQGYHMFKVLQEFNAKQL